MNGLPQFGPSAPGGLGGSTVVGSAGEAAVPAKWGRTRRSGAPTNGEPARAVPGAWELAPRWKDLRPSPEELKISARVMLHLGGLPRFHREEVPDPSRTQAGIAAALGTSQGAISNVLRRLVDGGALQVERMRVRRRYRRLKVYWMTRLGEVLLHRIRESARTDADVTGPG